MTSLLIGLFALSAFSVHAADLGFRYSSRHNRCVNSAGAQGLNPTYLGQCADWQGGGLYRQNFRAIDMSGSVFAYAQIIQGQLSGSNFTSSNWEWADVRYADGTQAVFRASSMKWLVGDSMNLYGADLSASHLEWASLTMGDLRQAKLRAASLLWTNLKQAFLDGADFSLAAAMDANFSLVSAIACNFRKADLSRANFTNGVFTTANFTLATLRSTNLTGAFFNGADFTGADLSEANLTGADFRSANLTNTILRNATFDQTTGLPFDRDEAKRRGMIFTGG